MFLGSTTTELWVEEGDAQVKQQLILASLEPTASTNCPAQDPCLLIRAAQGQPQPHSNTLLRHLSCH